MVLRSLVVFGRSLLAAGDVALDRPFASPVVEFSPGPEKGSPRHDDKLIFNLDCQSPVQAACGLIFSAPGPRGLGFGNDHVPGVTCVRFGPRLEFPGSGSALGFQPIASTVAAWPCSCAKGAMGARE
jgi:hypothetical protein